MGKLGEVAEGSTVAEEYLRRREAHEHTLRFYIRRDLAISHSRTAIALVAALLAWLALGPHILSGWWLAAPAIVFVGLMVLHERTLRNKQRAERATAFYDAGLRRLENRWTGRGITKTDFAAANHPYAADLDLFGRGSLFDLLCVARTQAGQNCLAAWLLNPADAPTIRERQESAAELRPRLDFREELALLGEETSVEGGNLAPWGEAPPLITSSGLRLTALALAAAGVASALAWWPGHQSPIPLLIVLAIGQIFLYQIRVPLRRILSGVEKAIPELELLAALLARLEREPAESPLLRRLRAELDADGTPPSIQIKRLERILGWLNLQQSIYLFPFARLLLWSVHCAVAIEAWRSVNGRRLGAWIRVIGEFEALSSLANYHYEHPLDPFPEIIADGPVFAAEGLAHPLLPVATAVSNAIALGEGVRLYIVSGSNMSGKSTLLRSIGINTVLALSGAPVRARSLRVSPLQVGASLRTQDSLQGGVSRFYAEILRLRQIVGLADATPPLLFLLDEILHGTNSHDRLIGAEAIARSLVRQGAIGLLTTHDLALARIEFDTELHATNIHFEDQLIEGKMSFDYHLRPGVVARSNALELMRAVGLDV